MHGLVTLSLYFLAGTMSDRDMARDKAARLLKKQGSVSSFTSSEKNDRAHKVG